MCCTFDFYFPDSDVEHLVIYFLAFCMSYLGGKLSTVKNSIHFVYCI